MSPLFQTEILLDFVFQPIADFLLSVHRQDGRLLAKPNLEMAALGGSKRASFAAPAISRIPWLSRSQGNTNVALPTELLRWGPGLRGVRIADRVAATSVPAGDHGATELRCRRIRRVFDFDGEALPESRKSRLDLIESRTTIEVEQPVDSGLRDA